MMYKNISCRNIYHLKMVCYRDGFRHSLWVEGILFDAWPGWSMLSGYRGCAAAVNPVILERQVNEAVDAQGRKVTGGTRPGLNFAVIAVLHPPLNRWSIHHRTHAVN